VVDFPDHSAKEELIRSSGDVELLRKRGEKILRWKRSRWGSERERWRYALLRPYASGRVLHAGLGLGISAEEILARTEVTELICYEWLSDVVAIYQAEHGAEPRLTLETADAHLSKPSGTFDVVLYELPMDNAADFDQSKAYMQWAWGKLNAGGHVIMPHNRFSVALVAEFPQLAPITVSAQYSEPGIKTSLRPRSVWLVVTK
jgi:hypothetical protein